MKHKQKNIELTIQLSLLGFTLKNTSSLFVVNTNTHVWVTYKHIGTGTYVTIFVEGRGADHDYKDYKIHYVDSRKALQFNTAEELMEHLNET